MPDKKGLKLQAVRSEGLDFGFWRYQISEHVLIPVQSSRQALWLPGKIIHHLRSWMEARAYFEALAPQYDELDLAINPTVMDVLCKEDME